MVIGFPAVSVHVGDGEALVGAVGDQDRVAGAPRARGRGGSPGRGGTAIQALSSLPEGETYRLTPAADAGTGERTMNKRRARRDPKRFCGIGCASTLPEGACFRLLLVRGAGPEGTRRGCSPFRPVPLLPRRAGQGSACVGDLDGGELLERPRDHDGRERRPGSVESRVHDEWIHGSPRARVEEGPVPVVTDDASGYRNAQPVSVGVSSDRTPRDPLFGDAQGAVGPGVQGEVDVVQVVVGVSATQADDAVGGRLLHGMLDEAVAGRE